MTDILSLFDAAEPPRVAPPGQFAGRASADLYADGALGHEATDTSEQAAHAALHTAGRDAARVLAAITDRASAGLTDDEGEQVLALRHTTYSARRRGLVLDGLVVDSGARRLTSANRKAIVWIAKAARELSERLYETEPVS